MDTKKGKDLQAFRELHDKSYIVPKKIAAALAELGDSWEYEVDFMKRCQVSPTDLARYREQFNEFHFEARVSNKNTKRVWCGTKKFATKLREQATT
jgi:hypothetical protein